MRNVRRVLMVAIAAVIVVSGCGSSAKKSNSGSAGTPTTLGPPLAKADFISQADAICDKYDAKTTEVAKGLDGIDESDTKKIVDFVIAKLLPLARERVDELRKLNPPAADRAQITALFDQVDQGTDEGEQKLKTDPQGALGDFDPYKDANIEAKAYGFKSCGES